MTDEPGVPHGVLAGLVERQAARIADLEAEIAELRRQLGLNSQNSSKPPSSDSPFVKPSLRSRRGTGRKPGGQPGHQGSTLEQVGDPDEVVRHEPAACGGCGAGLAGTTKPISEVKIGDRVLATDPETGEQSEQLVTMVWIHEDTLADLELEYGTILTTTEDHPFWNETDQEWQRAHTYFVSTGEAPILVHNDGGWTIGPAKSTVVMRGVRSGRHTTGERQTGTARSTGGAGTKQDTAPRRGKSIKRRLKDLNGAPMPMRTAIS